MSRVLVAADICQRALRAIGAFPITESAPEGEHLREAMSWLDMVLAEIAGTERLFKRVEQATMSLPLTNGTQSYDLYSSITDLPTDKIQFVVNCWIEDEDGNRYEIEIVQRNTFENVAKPADTGRPLWVYIDRDETAPILRVFPTPASDDAHTWTLKLVGQRFAPNVAPDGVTGTKPSASATHDFGVAWNRWMVVQLAHDLGSGPIFKLPDPSLTRFAAMALSAKTRLLAFENREQDTEPPVCDAPGGWLDSWNDDWPARRQGYRWRW